ncbi:MAG: threonylcarbamoyl-AMP synthase [Streptococcaceae bacterium]|jgi:L-threonylcarbamoyladenylate synthase|nr:threonylcarbamoyl-AMP synthase [Streptococcaceae bacterium]
MTQILQPKDLKKAVEIIKAGGLVAFPTETVYGLGADARNQKALGKIFAVKKRAKNNPLNLNIADVGWINEFIEEIPTAVQKVMDAFWPGPLTIILPLKRDTLSKLITGGSASIGFRMPQNKTALALIRAVGIMVGPSANLSGKFSTTKVEHVLSDLDRKIDAILDDDENLGGIESTILDISNLAQPKILRPGAITKEMLEVFLPNIQVLESKKHYKPNVSVAIIDPQKQGWQEGIFWAKRNGQKIGLLADKKIIEKFANQVDETCVLTENNDLNLAAKQLFSGLRKLDESKQPLDVIFVQTFEGEGLALAYRNRLLKTAGLEERGFVK